MNQIILEAKNITKSFGSIHALKNVDFYLYESKIHGLLGENGAGKSSLMNILSGIYQPEVGSIHINGNKVKKLNPDFASKLGIGMFGAATIISWVMSHSFIISLHATSLKL